VLALIVSLPLVGCRKRPVPTMRGKPTEVSRQEDWRAFDDLPIGSSPRLVTPEAFDKVRSGMTLGELTDVVGRGWLSLQYSGTGAIRWECADGRQLTVLPIMGRREEIIRTDGGSGGIGQMWMTAEQGKRAVEVPKKEPA